MVRDDKIGIELRVNKEPVELVKLANFDIAIICGN